MSLTPVQIKTTLEHLCTAEKKTDWVKADLSVEKSTFLGRFLWSVVQHFEKWRFKYYGIDLNQSQKRLEDIQAKVLKDNPELIAICHKAIQKFNSIVSQNHQVKLASGSPAPAQTSAGTGQPQASEGSSAPVQAQPTQPTRTQLGSPASPGSSVVTQPPGTPAPVQISTPPTVEQPTAAPVQTQPPTVEQPAAASVQTQPAEPTTVEQPAVASVQTQPAKPTAAPAQVQSLEPPVTPVQAPTEPLVVTQPPVVAPTETQPAEPLAQPTLEQARDRLRALKERLPRGDLLGRRLDVVLKELEQPSGNKGIARITLANLEKPADQLLKELRQNPWLVEKFREDESGFLTGRLNVQAPNTPNVRSRIGKINQVHFKTLSEEKFQQLLALLPVKASDQWVPKLNEMGKVLGLELAFKQIDAGLKLKQLSDIRGLEEGVKIPYAVLSENREKLSEAHCADILNPKAADLLPLVTAICDELMLSPTLASEKAKAHLRGLNFTVSKKELRAKIDELSKVKSFTEARAYQIGQLSARTDVGVLATVLDELGKECKLEDAFAVIDSGLTSARLKQLFTGKNKRLENRATTISFKLPFLGEQWRAAQRRGSPYDLTPFKKAQELIFALKENLSDEEYLKQLNAVGAILTIDFAYDDREAARTYVLNLQKPGLDPVLAEKLGLISERIRTGHAEAHLEKTFALKAEEAQVDAIGKELGLEAGFAAIAPRMAMTRHLEELFNAIDSNEKNIRVKVNVLKYYIVTHSTSEEQLRQKILALTKDPIEELGKNLDELVVTFDLGGQVNRALMPRGFY